MGHVTTTHSIEPGSSLNDLQCPRQINLIGVTSNQSLTGAFCTIAFWIVNVALRTLLLGAFRLKDSISSFATDLSVMLNPRLVFLRSQVSALDLI